MQPGTAPKQTCIAIIHVPFNFLKLIPIATVSDFWRKWLVKRHGSCKKKSLVLRVCIRTPLN
jgi:hypothetical protein